MKAFSNNNDMLKTTKFSDLLIENEFHLYIQRKRKANKGTYDILSKDSIYNRSIENYKILALDILRNLEKGIAKYDSERQMLQKI